MKRVFLVFLVAWMGLTLFAQQTVEQVIIDSVRVDQDSVARVSFRVVRYIRDTTLSTTATLSDLNKSLKLTEERVKFTSNSVKSQLTFTKDSISDSQSKQLIMQQIYQQNNTLGVFINERDMLLAIKKEFKKVLKIK